MKPRLSWRVHCTAYPDEIQVFANLRDALAECSRAFASTTDTIHAEASADPEQYAHWFTWTGFNYRTGEEQAAILFFPESTTPASRARLCRYLKGAAL